MCLLAIILIHLILLYIAKEILRIYRLFNSVSHIPSLPRMRKDSNRCLTASPFRIGSKEWIFNRFIQSTYRLDRTYKIWIGPVLTVVVQEKDGIRAVLNGGGDKPLTYFLPEFGRNGLLSAHGTSHSFALSLTD